MSLLAIFALVFILVLVVLIILDVPVSQKVINILLLIIAALILLNGSGLNLHVK